MGSVQWKRNSVRYKANAVQGWPRALRAGRVTTGGGAACYNTGAPCYDTTPDRTRKDTRMRKVIPLAVIMSGAALLAACGSSTKYNEKSLEALIKSQQPTPTEYLPIYKELGIPNAVAPNSLSPQNEDGFPYIVPNAARILVPKQLEAAIKDTKNPYINGNYIGKNLTPNQRMAIYSAKMIMDAMVALVLPQYVLPQRSGLVPVSAAIEQAKIAISDIQATDGFVYGTKTVPAVDLTTGTSNPQSLFYHIANASPLVLGALTQVAAIARYNAVQYRFVGTIAGVTMNPAKDSCYIVTVPAGKQVIATSFAHYAPTTHAHYVDACVVDKPGEWTTVWPMRQAEGYV